MELGAHDVVIVAGEDANAGTRLPVPDANRLVIRATQNPRVLVMKLDHPNVVEMSQ